MKKLPLILSLLSLNLVLFGTVSCGDILPDEDEKPIVNKPTLKVEETLHGSISLSVENNYCDIDDLGVIYPISVGDYKKLQKYIQYLIFSEKHLNLTKEAKLLNGIIVMIAGSKCKDANNLIELNEKIFIVLEEIAQLFSLLTKKNIIYIADKDGYIFKDNEETVNINNCNFDILRKIVLKMCLIKEPKIFKDKITQKWYEKALIAKRSKSPDIQFEDILITVSQDMKMSYEEIKNLNIFQLYSYYYRINHVENYKAITIFRTCSSKLPNINYSDGILQTLYKEETLDDLTISADSLGKML